MKVICEYCGAEFEFDKAISIKEYCGCGCNDYFCDTDCQQKYIDEGAKDEN